MLVQNSFDLPDVHPFVKWAGGKGQLLPELNRAITTQLSPQLANAQAKPSLMTGQLTAASNSKPFGGTTNRKLCPY